jgi:EAL domain-containing protein (putative c-di-GMP-specific phosphodiesterase class I)
MIGDDRAKGLRVAIDDFGAGYAGLNLLADFQPDAVKLDMQLVRSIDSKAPAKRSRAQSFRPAKIWEMK